MAVHYYTCGISPLTDKAHLRRAPIRNSEEVEMTAWVQFAAREDQDSVIVSSSGNEDFPRVH